MGTRGIVVLLLLCASLGALLLLTDQTVEVKKQAETAVLEGRSLADAAMIRWQFRERPPIELGRGAAAPMVASKCASPLSTWPQRRT